MSENIHLCQGILREAIQKYSVLLIICIQKKHGHQYA